MPLVFLSHIIPVARTDKKNIIISNVIFSRLYASELFCLILFRSRFEQNRFEKLCFVILSILKKTTISATIDIHMKKIQKHLLKLTVHVHKSNMWVLIWGAEGGAILVILVILLILR